jgi:NitT/TauT family transport system substrate-binding protein
LEKPLVPLHKQVDGVTQVEGEARGENNKALDAAITAEPFVTYMVKSGLVTQLMGVDEYHPEFQNAVTFYGQGFIEKKPELAQKFMNALIRALRFYHEALQDGKLHGPNAEEVIRILTQFASLKDAATYRDIYSQAVDPDGGVNVDSLRTSWTYFKDTKQIDGSISVDDVLDLRFVRAAVAKLGPYRSAGAR